MKRKQPEQILHTAVANFLHQGLRTPTFWTTFPAGGGGAFRGAFLKGMGLKAGFPDILVVHPQPLGAGLGCIVLGIELKAGKGRVSPEQVDVHAALTIANARVRVCRSLDDVEAFIRGHGVPLFASIGGVALRVAA